MNLEAIIYYETNVWLNYFIRLKRIVRSLISYRCSTIFVKNSN